MQGVYFSISKETVIDPKRRGFEDNSDAMQCERERNTQAEGTRTGALDDF